MINASSADELIFQGTEPCNCGFAPNRCASSIVGLDTDLRMECSDEYACGYMDMSMGGGSELAIQCTADYACEGSTLSAFDTNLTLECSGERACYGQSITINGTANVTIACESWDACWDVNLHIDGDSEVTIQCLGWFSCYMSISITGDSVLDMTCAGFRACEKQSITIDGNANVNIACVGSAACRLMDIKLPYAAVFDAKCEPSGVCKGSLLYNCLYIGTDSEECTKTPLALTMNSSFCLDQLDGPCPVQISLCVSVSVKVYMCSSDRLHPKRLLGH